MPLWLTVGAEYGLRAMVYMSSNWNGSPIPLHKIAAECEIPENYLSKVLQRLVVAGILRSYRGSKKGFSIVKDPSEISMLEVIEGVEGPIEMYFCVRSPESCKRSAACPVRMVMMEVQERALKTFSSTCIQDLLSKGRELETLGIASVSVNNSIPTTNS